MSRNIDRIIESQKKRKQELEDAKNLKTGKQKVLRDPKMLFHIERAAQVLFEVAKTQRRKMGNPQQQAQLMKKEMKTKIEEIGMVFDKKHREILKFIKKKK